jgi:glycosyltransferase involved in cell wall biosynthesis
MMSHRTKACVGIAVRERADLVASTLDALEAAGGGAEIMLLADGAEADRRAAFPLHRVSRVLNWEPARGPAACFNRLVKSGDAEVYVLLENGARPAPGWLEHLLRALASDSSYGLAGPSTNLGWNEQCAFPGVGGTAQEIEQTAHMAGQRFADSVAYLEPLHSLADFCYAVKREVVEAIGAADEGYGLGPCWEMDYNIRAARAGFRAVWAKSAYVWRRPRTARENAEQAALFEHAKRRYQDRFCGLRLRRETQSYDTHCTGDACPHFAPAELIPLRQSFEQAAQPAPPAADQIEAPATATGAAPLPGRPLVSCIMPTCNRRPYVAAAIDSFLKQDYEPKELVIVDDGGDCVGDLVPGDPRVRYVREPQRLSLGAKRNLACGLARGQVFVHWDDDDWHAPWRVSYQVGELLRRDADLCGLERLWFYDPQHQRAWQYRYPGVGPPWVAGGTFCFRRTLWERHRFADVTVGEDTRYVREAGAARIAILERDDFYVARVHAANTSRKHTTGSSWHPVDVATVRELIEERFARAATRPLVSCIMPTADRRAYVPLALAAFAAQSYPNLELIVVDDGTDAVRDLMPGDPRVRYIRSPARRSIGSKRNLACAEARGEVLIQWDDDDWYAPQRVAAQVAPILAGQAQLTGLEGRWVMSLPAGEFWQVSPALHRRMFFADVHGGTLAFARSVWEQGAYPDGSLGEDAAFLRLALGRGKRLQRIANDDLYVYTRHQGNAWRFQVGQFLDSAGWHRVAPPEWLPGPTLRAYLTAAASMPVRGAAAG